MSTRSQDTYHKENFLYTHFDEKENKIAKVNGDSCDLHWERELRLFGVGDLKNDSTCSDMITLGELTKYNAKRRHDVTIID